MGIGLALVALVILAPAVRSAPGGPAQSVSYGTTADGRLENGVALPAAGPNFTSYSTLGVLAGRTFVHGTVREIVVEAYRRLERESPDIMFVLGESGLRSGGAFPPHRTHQNGLSVDFMVPVTDASGRSVPLPTGPLNRYGYDLEFDGEGKCGDLRIDFDAISAHLKALSEAAADEGVGISRVIFAPELRARLIRTEHGPYVQAHVPVWKGKPWVRHDEHYHVDFAIPCKPLRRPESAAAPEANPRRPIPRPSGDD